jgi:hypothetical protein
VRQDISSIALSLRIEHREKLDLIPLAVSPRLLRCAQATGFSETRPNCHVSMWLLKIQIDLTGPERIEPPTFGLGKPPTSSAILKRTGLLRV